LTSCLGTVTPKNKKNGARHRTTLLKVPVILRSLPKADDEESDRQRQILRYAQDDGLFGSALSEPVLAEHPGMTDQSASIPLELAQGVQRKRGRGKPLIF
jgi:hypothetical protein